MNETIDPAKPNPVGRPTSYLPEYNEQAYRLALLGATDKELADFFEVNPDTINEWKIRYPEFSVSIRSGKLKADAQVVEKLYDRAIGAEWTEEQAFKLKEQTAPGIFTEDVKIVSVKRAAPPDTQAISLWLRNRRPKDWKDKQDIAVTDETLIANNPTMIEIATRLAFLLARGAHAIDAKPTIIDNEAKP